MKKILSITLNSAIDNIIQIDEFSLGIIVDSTNSVSFPSGKAINSTRAISCLKNKITSICFVGKSESHYYEQLKSDYIDLVLYKVDGITRSNLTIVDSNHSLILHIKNKGFVLNKHSIDLLTEQLNNNIHEDDIIIISGSLPDGLPEDYYRDLIIFCNKRGGKVIFDSRENYLKHGISGIPYAIKPNLDEVKGLLGKDNLTLNEIVIFSQDLNHKGIELVFVSMGKEGVLLTKKDVPGYWIAKVNLYNTEYEGDEIGCGDAMIGGIATELLKNSGVDNILKKAVACGAANLLSKGPGIIKLEDVNMLYNTSEVKYCA